MWQGLILEFKISKIVYSAKDAERGLVAMGNQKHPKHEFG